ncbi:DNA-directed RNA polymerase subunit beta [Erysipelothrix rhusiopathiae]|uniref:DNA-directed RNA polymerase subunit beta n=1 Tax=Erysipelothrix rhusiopathiae TaxID=1648 RepID=UPI0023AFB94A|nr:DNA-directed RNA polymerase subunit beta [Erysipelothrix rhusiopathiae]MDE8118014.1 DNA-directed RNA polymerase subunit beta [Erysipelothrix rhusiopathiae]MDE8193393.1 DNA-directed RNA polymerase subunit beta [Erysipelothrix rhusiopathiae]MDE8202341.1 DNA-directed RNA polymerase subunit beta [Erysipelothrix rhusiopathiae]MDE8262931.1 DNA-directed RNA polymerase subunit beta [Erysipelothrix rhusiopathiae]MDE8324569.1 DNA-directed RNA polymerase subunit beta [Erysipelothrix rhusiopathiae]
MEKNQVYSVKKFGNKATRRDYSQVSGTLELPNLVEIQTDAYEWFKNEGLFEVFNEIYPIQSYNENVKLKFIDYSFGEPKYNVDECRSREANYAAPLRATMRLEVINKQTGEVIEKEEEVFLGDLPLMTETGTFIINGAERVIVSQIVRSPGAYFKSENDDKTGRDTFMSELIPSRGTWLEFMSDDRKAANGRVINMKVDRKRTIVSTILFKSFGLSLDLQEGEDAFDTHSFKTFLNAMNLPVYDEWEEIDSEKREFLTLYALLYTAFFGNYPEIVNSLVLDKTVTFEDSLRVMYENQRADEIPTTDGAINLMNAKFLDPRRYDLNKAGRYKIHKKLEVYNRVNGTVLTSDIKDINGNVVFEKGTHITRRDDVLKLREVLREGGHMNVFPLKNIFSAPDVRDITVDGTIHLVGRILSKDIDGDDFEFERGTVLTASDIETLKGEDIQIYTGIMAKEVVVTKDNVWAVLNYSQRLYTVGRMLDASGADMMSAKGNLVADRFTPNYNVPKINKTNEKLIVDSLEDGPVTMWLVGAAMQELFVAQEDDETEIVKIVGIDPLLEKTTIVASDIYATYSYFLNFIDGVGNEDDIDQLGNRRIRTVGELIQNQFRIGLSRMERVVKERMSISSDSSNLTPKNLTNVRPLTAMVKEFFSSSQLSQFMDQLNPLAELTNKRRISALGPGGLTRDRAGFEVRDVHTSHYGRICPIETPEGPNIGLISNLTSYGKIDKYGFIQTPYRIVTPDGKVTEDIIYLSADDEFEYVIAQANEVQDHKLVNEEVVVRYRGENILAHRDTVELIDVSPKQIVSVATAAIPFLENDDASRALMGANMQRQAVPLLKPNSPFVGTGIEHRIAKDSGSAVICHEDGIVSYVDANRVIVNGESGKERTYLLQKFRRSNQGTCINQKPLVALGEKVSNGDILADGPSMQNGELALGQNVTVAFMTWNGYNYEDAIIMSERLVKEDVYTSIHIEEYTLEVRETKLGPEEITRDIPNVSEVACRHLDARGIVMIGAEVKEGDILVGKVTPKGQSEISPEEKLLLAIFGEKSREVRDNSLKVPHGGSGIVQDIKIFSRAEGHDLPPGVSESVKVYIVQKRKIHEGDKMAGRHGNKGVISKILPVEDMPYMEDGTPVDIMLNPLGVPSRMNIGQILELHLGIAAKNLNIKFATSVFDGIETDELFNIMKEGNVSPDGKMVLYDGQTGERYDERISVGVMYMLKLSHMIDDKLHARATGPYSLVTQQPLGGKAQNGGQRFGEMEVWALYAYGAANTLQEILTIKSDDVNGRTKTYAAIQNGEDIPEPGIPESFRVLKHELQALALDVKFLDENKEEIKESLVDGDEEVASAPSQDVPQPEIVVEIEETNEVESLNLDEQA